jgi:DNA-binding response OmpR family regulator
MGNPAGKLILVVDDDPKVRLLLRRLLEQEGYTVREAQDAGEARAVLAADDVKLVTLDLTLGREDGLALAREIRAQGGVPIIMITGKGDPIDRVVGLELGADDYIAKPFHLREVLARIRAVLRRYASADVAPDAQAAASECLAFGEFVLDIGRRVLTASGGATIELTTAEFNLLELFARNPHRVLSRDDILDALKGHDWSPYDRSIDTQVARLRKKVEPEDVSPAYIKTVRGVGYVFATDVRRI